MDTHSFSVFRMTAACATVAVLAWVLPLGAFIKPSQEKTACGGKRAFHMCSSMGTSSAPMTASSGTVAYANASSDLQKTSKSATGSSDDLILAADRRQRELTVTRLSLDRFILPDTPTLLLQGPVPKS